MVTREICVLGEGNIFSFLLVFRGKCFKNVCMRVYVCMCTFYVRDHSSSSLAINLSSLTHVGDSKTKQQCIS